MFFQKQNGVERAQVRIHPNFDLPHSIKTNAALVESDDAVYLLELLQTFKDCIKDLQSLWFVEGDDLRESIRDALNKHVGLAAAVIDHDSKGIDDMHFITVYFGMRGVIIF